MESDEKRGTRRRRWKVEEVLGKIREAPDRSAKAVQKASPALYGAAIRSFGSWRAAVIAAGQDYNSVRKRKQAGHWTADRIKSEVAALEEKCSSHVRKRRADLYNAALRVFGSWKLAVESAGFDYNDIHRGWTSQDEARLRFKRSRPKGDQ